MNADYRILDVNENLSFKNKIDAINWCTEKDYSATSWQQACWPSNHPKSTDFRIWFPKLSDKRHGEYVATKDGFINYLSEDGEYFIYDDINGINNNPNPNDHYLGVSVIFAKDVDGDYIFRGVYKLDIEKSGPNHFVHNRIATKIKLVGKPVQRLEYVEADNNDDINTPKKPKNRIRKADGSMQYICGRCNTTFLKSQRCPECGQLVKE